MYKTTIVIWSDFDPSHVSLSRLAQEAEDGCSYCSKQDVEHVAEYTKDPDWDGTEFFEDNSISD